jgi:hypothetical protein
VATSWSNRALRLIDPAWEHDCHEGNVVLKHMRNVYEKAHGITPVPDRNVKAFFKTP